MLWDEMLWDIEERDVILRNYRVLHYKNGRVGTAALFFIL